MNEHAICMNCAHWDAKHMIELPIYDDRGHRQCHRKFAACKVNAVLIDAGDCLPMMAAEGNCQQYGEAFKATEDFFARRHEAKHENDGLPVMQLDPAALRPASHAAA